MSDIDHLVENLIKSFDSIKLFQNSCEFLASRSRTLSVKYLYGSLRSLLIASLWKRSNVGILIVVENKMEAKEILYDLELLVGVDNVALFSTPEKHLRHTSISNVDEYLLQSIDGLAQLSRNPRCIAIATPEIFAIPLPEPKSIQSFGMTLRRGDGLHFGDFLSLLYEHGFERKDFVERQGDVSVRGGIIDIYFLGWDNPLRIEFWGDNIDSIREFEPLSQRSIREVDVAEVVLHAFHDQDQSLPSTLFDYFSLDTLAIVDQPHLVFAHIEKMSATPESKNELIQRLNSYRRVLINNLGEADIEVKTLPQPTFDRSVTALTTELRKLAANKHTVFVCADGAANSRRLHDLTANAFEYSAEETESKEMLADESTTFGAVKWLKRSLSKGFVFPSAKIAVFTEHQVFERRHAQKTDKEKKFIGVTLRELSQLRYGDFIVHRDKGIGKFDGLEKITINNHTQECVRIIYEGGDILYVHLHHLHKVQKYSSTAENPPKLHKLGSSEWERKKAKTKSKLKDIARELIKLYAVRKNQPGYAFPSDTTWQKEFEAGFIYEDTPDQANATIEVKADMESSTPMDRLVCGDVGFGKTEVAIRAAFKAVQAGKQVVVLVPTTILAQQHYATFFDRLHRYPVSIEVLSRFRSAADQKEVAKKFSEGKIDIVVGTHRVLSNDIQPKDLGLLIIDEEQRFGVSAKEKLRKMRVAVDTLTLTATPIPRTLNFSLMGARDLSIIETPPRNRLPIETVISEWDDHSVAEAVMQEIERGGQVFFVSDRIVELTEIHARLLEMIPSLRCIVAHGQMESEKLENAMEKFLERKYDVLIATKIVESGLDIPNANTMFIHNAQNFGLAELYQLRGRVGRSNIQAYCQLIIPPAKTIGKTALRRLQALEECTDLGSGFQLALRDLEIRGAGNLLGAEQSGFIAEMGYDLYQRILDEAVSELHEEEFAELFPDEQAIARSKKKIVNEEISIDIDADALLPSEYVSDVTERYEYYRRLYDVRSSVQLQTIVSEMRDRFGRLPEQVENLLFAVELRILAMSVGFARLRYARSVVSLELPKEDKSEFYEYIFPMLAGYISTIKGAKFKQDGKKMLVEFPVKNQEEARSAIKILVAELSKNTVMEEESEIHET